MFQSIKKRKELIDRELEVYRIEKLAEITLDIAKAQEQGASQERDYECEWHSKKERLNTELAVLEAKKESYVSTLEERQENYVAEYTAVKTAKDQTISVLQKTIEELVKRVPEVKVIGVK